MVTLGQTQPLTQLSFSLSWSSQSCLDSLAQAKLRFWFLCRILLNYLTRINISDACQLLISGLYGPMFHHFLTSITLNGFTVFQLLNINNFGSHCIQVHHFQIYQLQLSVPIVSSVFTFHHHAQFILLISLISTSDLNFIILNSSILIWFSTSDSNFFSFNFCLKFKYQYHTQNLHFLNFNFDFCFFITSSTSNCIVFKHICSYPKLLISKF